MAKLNSDCLTIDREEFMEVAEESPEVNEVFQNFGKISSQAKHGDLTMLGVKCYFCDSKKHISLACSIYKKQVKGNMKQEMKLKKGHTAVKKRSSFAIIKKLVSHGFRKKSFNSSVNSSFQGYQASDDGLNDLYGAIFK